METNWPTLVDCVDFEIRGNNVLFRSAGRTFAISRCGFLATFAKARQVVDEICKPNGAPSIRKKRKH